MRYCILLFLSLVLTACPSEEKISKDDFLPDQIQLDLQSNVKTSRIEQSFPSMGLKYLCMISKEKNIAVFKYDTTIKTRNEIIKFLKNEVGVEGASPTLGCNDNML